MTGIVLAYDRSTFDSEDQRLLAALAPQVDMVKIGLQALTAPLSHGIMVGNAVHDFVVKNGGRSFQDWKLHDIGTTMTNAMANLTGRTSAVTIHASASLKALKEVTAINRNRTMESSTADTLLLGVTVLTDITADECSDTYGDDPAEVVCAFARKLIEAGFDGVVCSGEELEALKRHGHTRQLKTLVPGTRPSWAPEDDQKRVMSYDEVAELGATWTVVGRVVMKAPDPLEALRRVKEELTV